jgi:hypothetical protein
MNGMVLQDRDLIPFANYLDENRHQRPPDHLIIEWMAGETEETLVSRFIRCWRRSDALTQGGVSARTATLRVPIQSDAASRR